MQVELRVFLVAIVVVSLLPVQLKGQLHNKERRFYNSGYVLGLYLDSMKQNGGNRTQKMPSVDSGMKQVTYPLGATLYCTTAGEWFSVNAYADTNLIPDWNAADTIPFRFLEKQNFCMIQQHRSVQKIPDIGSDSIRFWGMYRRNGAVWQLVVADWLGVGKKTGLYSFHNYNQPEFGTFSGYRIPMRMMEPEKLFHYHAGDWLEYEYDCPDDHEPYLSGPEDYQLLEVKSVISALRYHVRFTKLTREAVNSHLVETTSVTEADTNLLEWAMLNHYDWFDTLYPPGCSQSGAYRGPRFISYDSSYNSFYYSNNYPLFQFFEPRYDGTVMQEGTGIVSVYRSDSRTQTFRCTWLHAWHIGADSSGARFVSVSPAVKTSLLLFPNPAGQTGVEVRYALPAEFGYQMFDATGRLIQCGNTIGHRILPQHYWKPGLYLLQLSNGNRMFTARLVVN